MTPELRSALLTFCAFARLSMKYADAEMCGGPSEPRINALEHLGAALDNVWIADGDAPRFMRPIPEEL